jgi:hypothetical protein
VPASRACSGLLGVLAAPAAAAARMVPCCDTPPFFSAPLAPSLPDTHTHTHTHTHTPSLSVSLIPWTAQQGFRAAAVGASARAMTSCFRLPSALGTPTMHGASCSAARTHARGIAPSTPPT